MTRAFALAAAALFAAMLPACTPHANPDDAFVASVHRVRPSVVLLTMKATPENKKDKYDDAYATGFVVASGAWGSDILSVQHAVDGAWDFAITVDDKKRYPATVVATDAGLDLALLRTKQPNLPAIPLGSSKDLHDQLGREIGVLGYPVPDDFDDEDLGLAISLSSGRLSSIRKEALEVTLPIIPGESGAPIFLADTGDVIGVAESRFDEEHDIGFALPIDEAKRFLHHHAPTHFP